MPDEILVPTEEQLEEWAKDQYKDVGQEYLKRVWKVDYFIKEVEKLNALIPEIKESLLMINMGYWELAETVEVVKTLVDPLVLAKAIDDSGIPQNNPCADDPEGIVPG